MCCAANEGLALDGVVAVSKGQAACLVGLRAGR